MVLEEWKLRLTSAKVELKLRLSLAKSYVSDKACKWYFGIHFIISLEVGGVDFRFRKYCQAQPQLKLQLWLRLVLVSIPPKPPVQTSSEHQ